MLSYLRDGTLSVEVVVLGCLHIAHAARLYLSHNLPVEALSLLLFFAYCCAAQVQSAVFSAQQRARLAARRAKLEEFLSSSSSSKSPTQPGGKRSSRRPREWEEISGREESGWGMWWVAEPLRQTALYHTAWVLLLAAAANDAHSCRRYWLGYAIGCMLLVLDVADKYTVGTFSAATAATFSVLAGGMTAITLLQPIDIFSAELVGMVGALALTIVLQATLPSYHTGSLRLLTYFVVLLAAEGAMGVEEGKGLLWWTAVCCTATPLTYRAMVMGLEGELDFSPQPPARSPPAASPVSPISPVVTTGLKKGVYVLVVVMGGGVWWLLSFIWKDASPPASFYLFMAWTAWLFATLSSHALALSGVCTPLRNRSIFPIVAFLTGHALLHFYFPPGLKPAHALASILPIYLLLAPLLPGSPVQHLIPMDQTRDQSTKGTLFALVVFAAGSVGLCYHWGFTSIAGGIFAAVVAALVAFMQVTTDLDNCLTTVFVTLVLSSLL